MNAYDIKSNSENRFLKLSLKKNRQNEENETKKINRSSDVVVLDDSFDRLVFNLTKNVGCTKINKVQSAQTMHSPILIQDSSLEDSLPKITLSVNKSNKNDKGYTPNKSANIFDCTIDNITPDKSTQPSYNGWSPAQNIVCTRPKHDPTPSTPKEDPNKSVEHCSMPKIQKSQIKLLNELYGEVWKSIPRLFKTMTPKANFDECTKKLDFDDDSDKENTYRDLKLNRELFLTESDKKKGSDMLTDTEKKSKRKLYTEKILSHPEIPKTNIKSVKSTTKEINTNEFDSQNNKELFLTGSVILKDIEKKSKRKLQMENVMNTPELPKPRVKDVKSTSKKLEVTKEAATGVVDLIKSVKKLENLKISAHGTERLSFMASLADDVPSWRCDIRAIQYRDNFKELKEKLTRQLFARFNKCVFDNALRADMPIVWDTKFRSTAGTATNRRLKTSDGEQLRVSSIKLSTKVVDSPQRLRDTLIHELCHSATWVIDGVLKAGHGPLWKKWAERALKVFPELGKISRCHDMQIHFKYSYQCTRCGLRYQRHSKSIDISIKRCGGCRGTLELLVNKKTKDGVVSTPARKGNTNNFALYVKENYATVKDGKTHAQVMKMLGEQFSAKKNKHLLT